MFVYREAASLQADLGWSVALLYTMSNQRNRLYTHVKIPKSDGTVRTLCVPKPPLKAVQRRIHDVILSRLPVSPHATAYRRGISMVKGALPHCGREVLLKLDIADFFGSIRYSDVKRAAFPADRFSEPLRILLAHLCYFEDALPQGAPTSPAISNLVMKDFDEEVAAFCAPKQIVYTRYCDDMTFSGSFDPKEVKAFVAQALFRRGFRLNLRKTVVARRHQRQTVTGLVVNQHPAVSANTRRQVRQAVYYCRRFGVSDHLAHIGASVPPDTYLRSLLGQVQYICQTHPTEEWQEARRFLLDAIRTK